MPVNMSYCRFANTLEALRECADALHSQPLRDLQNGLGDYERRALRSLLLLCRELGDDFLEPQRD